MIPTVIIFSVLVFIILLVSGTDKNRAGRVQFFAKGKDLGFSFREIELLYKLAVKAQLEDPSSLFYSQEQLDSSIKALVKNMNLTGGDDDTERQDFLAKLYEYRKKIEMEKPHVKNGISNTRQISDSQNLRILIKGTGVFKAQIIKNTNGYMTISRPVSNKLPESFTWNGQKLSVYFWRDEDAGYVFETEVMDDFVFGGISSLKISHSDSLARTQKRKSIRVRVHKAAYLYPVTNEEEIGRVEINPGLKCFLEDISDTGCAVTVGGKGQEGLRVKVQFVLNNTIICMSGTVRSLAYKGEFNRSLLHIEADPLPIETRNQILGEVFGMLPEDEEDLPFTLLGEEEEEVAPETVDHELFFEDSGSTEVAV